MKKVKILLLGVVALMLVGCDTVEQNVTLPESLVEMQVMFTQMPEFLANHSEMNTTSLFYFQSIFRQLNMYDYEIDMGKPVLEVDDIYSYYYVLEDTETFIVVDMWRNEDTIYEFSLDMKHKH